MFDNVKFVATQHKKNIAAVNALTESELHKELANDVSKLFESYPNLDGFVMLGWTPEWNDGEDCLHSDEVFVRPFNKSRCWGTLQEAADRVCGEDAVYAVIDDEISEYDLDEEVVAQVQDMLQWNQNLSSSDQDKLQAILNDLTTSVHECIGTDWLFIISRKPDGSAKVEHHVYECGY